MMPRPNQSLLHDTFFHIRGYLCIVILMFGIWVLGLSPVLAESENPALAEEFYAKGMGYYWAQETPQHYEEAFVWLSKAAEYGHPRAQSIVGDMYNLGLGTAIDQREGWGFIQDSVEQGDLYGQFLFGKSLYWGLGVEKDKQKGTRMLSTVLDDLEAGAASGDPLLQYGLAWIYGELSSATKDYQKAQHWYEKAAVQGYAMAQNNLGVLFERGNGARKNSKAKVVWYRRAADQGLPIAQYNLAIAFGEQGDTEGEFGLYRVSANRNYGPAQFRLGAMYERGDGIPINIEKAILWYRKAAGQKHRWAQYRLGRLFQYGTGVEQDYQEAMRWYRMAADRSFEKAISKVGYFYEKGMGVSKDYQKAKEWFVKGARLGNSDSQAHLGYLYLYGLGVDQNFEEANSWLLKAVRGGDEWAYYGIGLIHEEKQQYSQAIRWYLLSAIKGYDFGLKRAVYLLVLYPVNSFKT